MRHRAPLLAAILLCGVACGSAAPATDSRAGDGPRALELGPLPGAIERSPVAADAPGRTPRRAAVREARHEVPQTQPTPRVTLAFTGDTLVHSPLVRRALANGSGSTYDFSPMFADVAPIISAADFAVCHLETPIAPDGEELSTYPLYGVPPEVVTAIAGAGYDRCSTASNHSMDRGVAGIDATLDAFARAGIGQSGMARSADEEPDVVHVGGVGIAHLSYTYGFNGLRLPPGEPWRSNPLDADRIVADARAARERGAQVVVVSIHWGDEGSTRPNAQQREVAEAVTASAAVDLIVGHHAHVIQPIEQVNGRWVAYGLGDWLSNLPVGDQWSAATQDGVILQVTIERRPDGSHAVGRPVALPTWVDKQRGFVIVPVLAALADQRTPDGLRAQLEASLARTSAVIGAFVPV